LFVRYVAINHLVNDFVCLGEEGNVICSENVIEKVAVHINQQFLTLVLLDAVPKANQLLLYKVKILLLVEQLLNQVVCKRLALFSLNISE
jgi:hypothetical protein